MKGTPGNRYMLRLTVEESKRKKKQKGIHADCKPILEPKHANLGTAAYLSLVSGKNPSVRKKSPM